MAEGFLDATEGEEVSGLLGNVDDLDGILDLDFIANVPGSTENTTSVGSENPHAYQVGMDQLGRLAKAGLNIGATKALWGVTPLLCVAAHTPVSFFRVGAKKLGGGTLDNFDKLSLVHGFHSGTPLSSFISRFVDIVFPGSTTLDED